MNGQNLKAAITVSETLFSEHLTGKNKTVLEQMSGYRKAMDIYERTQVAMGRRAKIHTYNCSTKNLQLSSNAFGTTKKI